MKKITDNRLKDIENEFPFDVGASSVLNVDAFAELLYWIDDNNKNIPRDALLDRGYISTDRIDYDLFNLFGNSLNSNGKVLFRAGNLGATEKRSTLIATWISIVSFKAGNSHIKKYDEKVLTKDCIAEFVKLSKNPENLKRLPSILEEAGIIFIVEPAFDGLGIDGVCFVNGAGVPVIGHSLRHDRYDNFWFTLLHELSHILVHYDQLTDFIVEDLESASDSEIEREANYLATNFVVSNSVWRRCDVVKKQTVESVYSLAKGLDIHPALIAGKFQFEKSNFKIFREITDSLSVRGILGF